MPDSITRRSSEVVGPGGSPPAESSSPETAAALGSASTETSGIDQTAAAEGSSARARAVGSPEDQKTVISKRPPMAEPLLPPRAASPSEMGRILVGERLGHFQLEEFVGGGGMGAVFKATDTMLGRTVAVKVLSREQTDDETLLRFQKEAQNAARLDHERIARVYYVNEDQGWHYIVFEYIDGVNIRDLVDQQGPLSVDEAVYYTLQVTEALRHASRRDVVHRDIKPSNILVMADGRVKLVDMGLARSHQVESSQNDLTQSGVTLGTFDYISPEQAREPRNADVRSDIYSLGCTLYFMLTGRPPFPDGTVLQKLLSHSSDAPPDPRLYRPDIPEDICRTLTKMLAKNPGQRFQSPDELIADLLRIADRLGLERTSSSGAVWIARPDARTPWYEKHLPWAAPVVTLVLVILALEWFAGAPGEKLAPPRPNLLPPVASAPLERRPGRPIIPVARNSDNQKTRSKTDNSGAPSGVSDAGNDSADRPDDEPPSEGTADEPMDARPPMETPAGSDSTPSESSAVADSTVPTRLLLVGPAGTPHTADAKVVPTLKAACEAAADLPAVEAIELHFDGERLEQPLSIALDNLTVRAAPGRTPVLVFRPAADLPLDEHRMLRLAPGNVTFQGVQFRLELPTEPAGDGWALFEVQNDTSLLLDRCALTIRNVTSTGALAQSGAAFLEVAPRVASDADDVTEEVAEWPLVRLFSTLARGEAPFIRSDSGEAFRIEWTQGLLATSERFAEIGGAEQLSAQWPRLEIELKKVTVAARQGLCLLRNSTDAPKHLGVKVSATDCIFLTDPSAALIQHRTRELFDDLLAKPPLFVGQGNIFAGSRQYWRIDSERVSDPVAPPLLISLDRGDEYGFEQEVWSESVMWKALPAPSRPVHTHVKADYLLSDDPANPALRRGAAAAGFDVTMLPEFVVEAPPSAASAAVDPPRNETPMPAPGPNGSTSAGMSEKMKMIMSPMTPAATTRPTPAPKPDEPVAPPATDAELPEASSEE